MKCVKERGGDNERCKERGGENERRKGEGRRK